MVLHLRKPVSYQRSSLLGLYPKERDQYNKTVVNKISRNPGILMELGLQRKYLSIYIKHQFAVGIVAI